MNVSTNKPQTLVLHAGPRNDLTTGAVAVPIFQTTSYQFRGTDMQRTCSRSRSSATSIRAS